MTIINEFGVTAVPSPQTVICKYLQITHMGLSPVLEELCLPTHQRDRELWAKADLIIIIITTIEEDHQSHSNRTLNSQMIILEERLQW